ncbi:DUF4176 domain-containing protein [Streptococcus equi]|uniref:DUF4176 domain-containing protein n=1 Tax=Streptococcus equi subsp. ruminatorum TaxID=254358 RepID=A0A6M1KYW5_9STRE|nr:DUF4176 domain-containing protein [Streptococcus equi]NGL84565.1 DUF4176 domain-containing protein [Streptococcus equi subsp. ruminatorum]
MSTVTMLPLGSIVILKGNTKKMMIIARVIAAPIKGEVYRFDYGACLYPEGMMGDRLIYFNHDDIFKIIQEGYADDDNALMLETIAQALATTDIPKGDVSALNDRKTVED